MTDFDLAGGAEGADTRETPETARRRRRIALIAGAGVVAIGVTAFFLTHQPPKAGEASAVSQAQSVTVAPTRPHLFAAAIQLSGEARPKQDIQVFAPLPGVRVTALLVDEGAQVRAGQPLARLDAGVANAQTAAAAAAVAEARAADARAADELRRALSLADSGALSTEQIEARRAQADAARARLAAAQAQAAEAAARWQGGFVRAPAAGLVIKRTAVVGQLVDGQPLFRIAGGAELELAAEVAEADILALAVGQTAEFRLVDGTPLTARLRRLPAALDSRTRTGAALFDLPRGSRARAGMFLRGETQLPPREGLAAPQAALVYADGQAFVFTVDAENRARRVAVRLGARDGELVEIVEGLRPGDRVIGAGAAFIQPGDLVRPIEAAPPPPASAAPALRGRS